MVGFSLHPRAMILFARARMRVLAGLPIRYRLFASFVLLLAVLGMAVAASWAGVDGVDTRQRAYTHTAHSADMAGGAAYNMRISQSQHLVVHALGQSPDALDRHHGADVSAFESALAAFGASVHDGQSRAAYAEARARYKRWAALDRTIETLAAGGHIRQATRLMNGRENALGDALAGGMSQLARAQDSEGAARTASNIASFQLEMALYGLTVLIVSAIVATVMIRSITRPLRELARVSRRVGAGELGTRVSGGGGGGELEDVATAFNEMADSIAHSHARLDARRREEEALRRVATAVAEGPGTREIWTLLAREVAHLMGAETGAVVRFSDALAGEVVGSWAEPGTVGLDTGTAVPLVGEGAVARVARTGQTARVENYASAGPKLAHLVGEHGFRSGIAGPVRSEGGAWGALWVATTGTEPLPARGEERLQRFSEMVGLAVSSAEAWERLEDMALTDGLTGLANRRAFHERLDIEIARARRHEKPLSIMMLDLDHFKRVNDTHGHDVGDSVLREIARRLRGIVRSGELIARVGGEEFAWILPDADSMAAFAVAERTRRVIGETPFDGVGRLTISAGVCDMEQAGSGDQLLRRADTALYWAKTHGRDVTFRYAGEVLERLPVDEQARRVERAKMLSAVRMLARSVDAKDALTLHHSEHVAALASVIASALGWPAERSVQLYEAGLVHDIGKIGVPDAVLLKSGALTPGEFEQVKFHAHLGAQIVAGVLTGEQAAWVGHHHERVDGTGYPDGLVGEDIPEGARILALADAWDAMISLRRYSASQSREEALAECRAQAGSRFWPAAVAVLDEALCEIERGEETADTGA